MIAVTGLVLAQLAEASVAPDRPDTADGWARATGATVLCGVLAALLLPGRGHLAGAGLVAVGAGLRVWAILTLGPLFLDGVALLPGHARVRRGPYRWLAHPAVVGTVLIVLGTAAVTGSWPALVLTLGALVPLQWARTRAEDRLWDARYPPESSPKERSAAGHVSPP